MTHKVNQVPKSNLDTSKTGCCPKFNPDGWDEQTFVFDKKRFVKITTRSFFYMPLNMNKVMGQTMKLLKNNDAQGDEILMMSNDVSPWKCEHFIAVNKDVPGAEMTEVSGTYLTKVFEGPFQDAGKWHKQLLEYAKSKGEGAKKVYFFYTTCPSCAKVYGKNYVVGLAQVK